MFNELSLESGMMILDEAFSRTRKIMEGYSNVKFSTEEYQRFYEYPILALFINFCISF